MDTMKNEKQIVRYICEMLDSIRPEKLRERMHILLDLLEDSSLYASDKENIIFNICRLPEKEEDDARF